MNLSQEENQNLTNVTEVLNLLKKGEFIKAMNEYLDDNVKLYEGNNPAKEGKAICLAEEEKLLSTVTEFGGYNVISGPAASGDTTFYEVVMEFKTNDGQSHKFEQTVRSQWKDGKIINERYYHV